MASERTKRDHGATEPAVRDSSARPRGDAGTKKGVGADAPSEESRSPARDFWIVAAVALLVRAVYLIQARDVPVFDYLLMDGAVYDAWARRIASGDWIGDEVFYQAPLYPYFLGVLKSFGAEGSWPIRIAQALLGSLSCGFLFLVAGTVFSRRVGWIAGLCLAFYPPAIFFDGLVQKAALGGFLVTLLLWLLVRAGRSPSRARWFGVGCALGLLMMTREETLLLAPVILAWALVFGRKTPWKGRFARVAAYLGGVLLVLLPVAARNAYVGGEFVLTTSQAGSNFYIGNHAGANGSYSPLRPGRSNTPLERVDARELAELGLGRQLSAKEVSGYWFDRSFKWIGEHPGDWVALLWRKTVLLFNAHEIADSEDQAYYAHFASILAVLSMGLNLGTLLPLAAVGMWASRRRSDETRLLLALFATLCVGVVAFYVFARYRYPIVPIAIVFAAVGAMHVVDLFRSRSFARLAVPAVLMASVGYFANRRVLDPRPQLAMAYSNAGTALFDAGEWDSAELQLRRSLELSDDPDTHVNLARVLVQKQRHSEALEALRKATSVRPDDPRFLFEWSRALRASGDRDGAIEAARKSLTAWPLDPGVWEFLGSMHAERGEWALLVDVSRRARDANPSDLSTSLSLVWLLATVPVRSLRDPGDAVRIGEDLEKRTNGAEFRVLDVLAVAYASAGRFQQAATKADAAAALASKAGEAALSSQIRERAQRFARGEPLVR